MRHGRRQAKLTDPEFFVATEYFQSLVPYLAPGFASTAYVKGKAAFAEGKNVLFEGGSADYTGFKNINPAWTSASLPSPTPPAWACPPSTAVSTTCTG